MPGHNPFFLPTFIAGIALVATATYIWRYRRRSSVARELLFVTCTAAINALGDAAEMASVTLDQKIFWHRFTWIGITLTPFGVAAFMLAFARRPLSRRAAALMSIIPLVTLVLAWTNPWHHWLATPPRLVDYGTFTMRRQDGAWAFWIFVVYGYICVVGSLIGYAAVWLAGSKIHAWQARSLFFATLAPWIGNAVYNFGRTPVPEFDPTPAAYGITSVAFAWVLFREKLLDLVPVAHEAVVAAMIDPVIVLDRADRVLDANPAALSLANQPSLEAGTPIHELFQDAPALIDAVLSAATSDVRVADREFECRTALLDAGEGRIVTLRDITDQKRDAALRESALRTAEQALRVRSEFMARMSHELRTPLHGIVGSIELLLMMLDSSRTRRFAEMARSSASGLLVLVNELLDFERLDADGMVFLAEPFDVVEVVEDTVESLRGAAELRGLSLLHHVSRDGVDEGPVALRGDPHRIRQIVMNLLGNAINFTERGEAEVRLRLLEVPGDRVTVDVRVDDTGPGIAADAREAVFEPFVQLDGTTTRRVDGAGLGLAIARGFAIRMGGTLTLEARDDGRAGVSARLTLSLPRADVKVVSPTFEPVRSLGSLRVLLAENHPVGRVVAVAMLEALGCSVTTAIDGDAAVDRALDEHPDVVLMDLHMPGTSGFDALRRIRASSHATVPVIAFTADARQQAREGCSAAGFDGYLLKPTTLATLREALTPFRKLGVRDVVAMESKRGMGVAMPEDFVRLYIESAQGEVGAMFAAVRAGDGARVRELAHGLAGASGLVQCQSVVEACHAILAAEAPSELLIRAVEDACSRVTISTMGEHDSLGAA